MKNDSADDLKNILNKKEYYDIILYFKITKLETINSTNILSKIFYNLEKDNKLNYIIEILNILTQYKIPVFEYEIKEGIRILIKNK
jgi:hypothetical protein